MGDADFLPTLCLRQGDCRNRQRGKCHFTHADQLRQLGLRRDIYDRCIEALAKHPDQVLGKISSLHSLRLKWADLANDHTNLCPDVDWQGYEDEVLASEKDGLSRRDSNTNKKRSGQVREEGGGGGEVKRRRRSRSRSPKRRRGQKKRRRAAAA